MDSKWDELESRLTEIEGFVTSKHELDEIRRKIEDTQLRISYFDTTKIGKVLMMLI